MRTSVPALSSRFPGSSSDYIGIFGHPADDRYRLSPELAMLRQGHRSRALIVGTVTGRFSASLIDEQLYLPSKCAPQQHSVGITI